MKIKLLKCLSITLAICLGACTYEKGNVVMEKNAFRNFCIETTCTNLENSGEHYQRENQGHFD